MSISTGRWRIGPGTYFASPIPRSCIGILGPPIAPEDMWNPDAVLRVEDIHHQPNTQERLDKAAATQMVFEDALIHIIDCLIRMTGSDRLVLTGGAALNAVANMRLLEHFDAGYYDRVLKRSTRLHLWVPPVPGDAGVTVGAAYAFAARRGGFWPDAPARVLLRSRPEHVRYPRRLEWAADLAWIGVGDASFRPGLEAIADLMAFITAETASLRSSRDQQRPGRGPWVTDPSSQTLAIRARASCSTSASSIAKRSDRSRRWQRFQPQRICSTESEGAVGP